MHILKFYLAKQVFTRSGFLSLQLYDIASDKELFHKKR